MVCHLCCDVQMVDRSQPLRHQLQCWAPRLMQAAFGLRRLGC